jgi:hypothetical protein
MIYAYVESRELRVVTIQADDNYWYYWLRGKLWLSNLASIFVVCVEDRDGNQHDIHVAITRRLSTWTRELKVLRETTAS